MADGLGWDGMGGDLFVGICICGLQCMLMVPAMLHTSTFMAATSATLVYFPLTCLHLHIATQYGAGLVAGAASVGGLVHIRAIILRQKRWEVQCAVARYFSKSRKRRKIM